MEKKSIEYVLPEEIEKRSFEIIAAELAERGITLPAEQDPVTRRVIHTSADFDYAETMTYSENAVEMAKNLIKNGADIVTDTNMALAGINKKLYRDTSHVKAICKMNGLSDGNLIYIGQKLLLP